MTEPQAGPEHDLKTTSPDLSRLRCTILTRDGEVRETMGEIPTGKMIRYLSVVRPTGLDQYMREADEGEESGVTGFEFKVESGVLVVSVSATDKTIRMYGPTAWLETGQIPDEWEPSP